MNSERPTIRVPAASLSDAALMADHRALKEAREADSWAGLSEQLAAAGQNALAIVFAKNACRSAMRGIKAANGGGR